MTALILIALISLAHTASAAAGRPRISTARETVVRTLDRGLADTPMRGTGRQLEASGWKWRVSPYFIAAIAGTESSFGRAACRGNPRNAFGLASCGDGWHVPWFASWAHAYDFMGRFLALRWPHARTAYDYRGYAACAPCWGAKTAGWMRSRFGVGPSVRYGA